MDAHDQIDPFEHAEQRRHLRALLGAAAVTALLLVWLSLGATGGFLSWRTLGLAAGWAVACFVLALSLLTTHLNRKLPDPSMSRPLVLAAAACVLGVAHTLEPGHRAAVLPWIAMAFAFAAFTERTRALVRLAGLLAVMMLAESALYVHANQHLGLVLWQLSVTLASIACTAVFCGHLNDRRAASAKRLGLQQTVLDSVAEAVVSLDLEGRITELNLAAQRLMQADRSSADGRLLHEVLLPAGDIDRRTLEALLQDTTQGPGAQRRARLQARLHAQTPVDLECTPALVHNRRGKVVGRVLVLRDISETVSLMRKLEHESTHDELTALLNRRGFLSALKPCTQALRAADDTRRHALLIIDLDHFKIVNDTCGHAAGDSLLKRVADKIREATRPDDIVARYGGDEFAVMLRDVSIDSTLEIANQVIKAVATQNFEWGGRRFQTGASVGCVMIDDGDHDTAKMMRKADSALYLAKDLGRGRVQIHEEGDEQVAKKSRELEWACRINDALETDSFELFAQRVICSDVRLEDHYEILVRMRETDGSLIAPGEFLPAAERFHLMPALDRWVVRGTLALLQRATLANQPAPKVAINLSAQSINERDFLTFVLDELDRSVVSADRICFELTETVAIAHFDVARHFVDTIRARGCTFALDDVGAGFNSFNYLRLLRFDTIKIDGQYVRNIDRDPVDRALVESVVRAASSLGLLTVAEMVESDSAVRDLRRMGVDQLQGFVIHRPEPLTALLQAFEEPPADQATGAGTTVGQNVARRVTDPSLYEI